MPITLPDSIYNDYLMSKSVMDEPRNPLQKAVDFFYGRTLPEQVTSGLTGIVPLKINPMTVGAHAEWPKLAKFVSDKLDTVGKGLGHRYLSFLQKHPRSIDIYDDFKGIEKADLLTPQYPRLPMRLSYRPGDIESAGHEIGHVGQTLFGQPDITPPGFGNTLTGKINQLLNQIAGNYKASELPGEVFPNFFSGGGKITDKDAAARWLYEATNPSNINFARWDAPLHQKKVWEGSSFYDSLPSLGYKWRAGDLTDPALRMPNPLKEFTGLISPEVNFGAYSVPDSKGLFIPPLYHHELMQKVQMKLKNSPDFDRAIQELSPDIYSHVRRGPEVNMMYGMPTGPDDLTVIPFWQPAAETSLAQRTAANAEQRHLDNVMFSLRDLNLIENGKNPTFMEHFYRGHE